MRARTRLSARSSIPEDAKAEQDDPPPSRRLAAEAPEREPDRRDQRRSREQERPARQRRERGDAPGVVGAGNQILRRFMMKGMCTWSSL